MEFRCLEHENDNCLLILHRFYHKKNAGTVGASVPWAVFITIVEGTVILVIAVSAFTLKSKIVVFNPEVVAP